jgi:hypothetical protein
MINISIYIVCDGCRQVWYLTVFCSPVRRIMHAPLAHYVYNVSS